MLVIVVTMAATPRCLLDPSIRTGIKFFVLFCVIVVVVVVVVLYTI